MCQTLQVLFNKLVWQTKMLKIIWFLDEGHFHSMLINKMQGFTRLQATQNPRILSTKNWSHRKFVYWCFQVLISSNIWRFVADKYLIYSGIYTVSKEKSVCIIHRMQYALATWIVILLVIFVFSIPGMTYCLTCVSTTETCITYKSTATLWNCFKIFSLGHNPDLFRVNLRRTLQLTVWMKFRTPILF
jgi:hypothetical protein